jgi:small GTP-binding protein
MDEYKIIFLGRSGVGKTSLTQRCLNMGLDPQATIGVAFHRKSLYIGRREVILNIWDTSGQERYNALNAMYVRNAKCAIIVLDVTDRDSFDNMNAWKKFCDNNDVPNFIIVGNKIDRDDRVVSEDEVREWCDHNLVDKCIFASALENRGHEELIESLIDIMAHCTPTTKPESFPILKNEPKNESCRC